MATDRSHPSTRRSRRRSLAITPYPYGDPSFENPSLFEANQRDRWSLSTGVSNPVVRPDAGYLSDPDLVYVPESGELRLYHRQVTTDNIVLLTRSTDGVRWSMPVGARHSTDGRTWGPPQRVVLEQPDLWPWHLDVQWIPSRQVFWAVYNAKTDTACTTPAVYLAESADRVM